MTFYADINECLENNGGCSQICSNTNGSFECSCEDGLYLASDGETCLGLLVCDIYYLINKEVQYYQFACQRSLVLSGHTGFFQ